jgi:hypothetical protein
MSPLRLPSSAILSQVMSLLTVLQLRNGYNMQVQPDWPTIGQVLESLIAKIGETIHLILETIKISFDL